MTDMCHWMLSGLHPSLHPSPADQWGDATSHRLVLRTRRGRSSSHRTRCQCEQDDQCELTRVSVSGGWGDLVVAFPRSSIIPLPIAPPQQQGAVTPSSTLCVGLHSSCFVLRSDLRGGSRGRDGLVNHGSDSSLTPRIAPQDGLTPLHWAATGTIVEALVGAGANVSALNKVPRRRGGTLRCALTSCLWWVVLAVGIERKDAPPPRGE